MLVNSLGEVVSRRDFMPFGEEIFPDGTHRTPDLKYTAGDNIRQKFTGYQKDEETQLDFAEARMYQSLHGRFTAVDPLLASGKNSNPQTFNRYVYVMNDPLAFTDPSGLQAATDVTPCSQSDNCSGEFSWNWDKKNPSRPENNNINSTGNLLDIVVQGVSFYFESAAAASREYFASKFSALSGSDPLQNLNYQGFEAVRTGDGEALNQRLFGFLGPRNFDILQATNDSFKAAETIANANLIFQGGFASVSTGYLSGFRFSQGISTGSNAIGGERSGAQNVANGSRLFSQLTREEASSVFTSSGRLHPNTLQTARPIRSISGNNIGNSSVVKSLTQDGSSISDWGKFTTDTFKSPSGPFQVHFYRNTITGQPNYSVDFKVVFNLGRVSRP